MLDNFDFKNGVLPPSIAPDHCFLNTVHRWNQSESFFVREAVTRTVCLVASSAISLISIVFHTATFLLKLPITSFRIVFGAIPIGNDRKFRDTFPTDTSFLHLMWHAYKIGFCAVDILFVPVIGFIHPKACTWVHLKMGAFFVEAPQPKQAGGSPVKPIPSGSIPSSSGTKANKSKSHSSGGSIQKAPHQKSEDSTTNPRAQKTNGKTASKVGDSKEPSSQSLLMSHLAKSRVAVAGERDGDDDGDDVELWDENDFDEDYEASVNERRARLEVRPNPNQQVSAQEVVHRITRRDQGYIDKLNRYDLTRCDENAVTNGKVVNCFKEYNLKKYNLEAIVQEKALWIEALIKGEVPEEEYAYCDAFLGCLSEFNKEMGRKIFVHKEERPEAEGPVVHDNSKAIAELEKYELPDVPSGIVKRNQYNGKANSMGYENYEALKEAYEDLLERSRDGKKLTNEDHNIYEKDLPAFAVQFPEIIKE